ncbi:hypothetical protein [Aegicerativicinus sediminis]|uniref:hypothetical protein n=1 Tax=Aegicerativicinus sediminis TaxID=2893202 RepID=UPI001E4E18B3|nr:hypothetical protein [Aegicerativicinus sediminis]
MASKRNLKKDINNVLGDIIDSVYYWENTNEGATKESEAIIDDAIKTFDDLMVKVNQRKLENSKTHFKGVQSELDQEASKLVDRVNKL